MVFRFVLVCFVIGSIFCSNCDYKGTSYRPRDTWVAEDKCNICTCQADGTSSCEAKQCTPVVCHENGRDYNLGETYRARDSCNECLCTLNGAVCTSSSCWQFGAGTGGTRIPRCYYSGRVYTVGDAFMADDGCNRCICTEKQVEVCTKMFCAPVTLTPPKTTKPPTTTLPSTTTATEVPTTVEVVTTMPTTGVPTTASPTTAAPTTVQIKTTTPQTAAPTSLGLDTTRPVTGAPKAPVTTDIQSSSTMAASTTVQTCNYNGRIYNVGDSFKADDGCNTCQCGGNDNLMCTLMACPPSTKDTLTTVRVQETTAAPVEPTTLPPATQPTKYQCSYDGQKYDYGMSFKAIDGCNVCICGQVDVLCSLMACATTNKPTPPTSASTTAVKCNYNGMEYDVGASFKADDGCNNCHCGDDGSVGCTKMLCAKTTKATAVDTTTSSSPSVTTINHMKVTMNK